MITQEWLTAQLCAVLAWQLANPGVKDRRDMPPVPMAGQRVWHQFLALHSARTSSGFGPNPISYGEMEAYGRVHREPVRPFEMDMVRALDLKFLEEARKDPAQEAEQAAEAKRKAAGPPSSEQIMAVISRAAAAR